MLIEKKYLKVPINLRAAHKTVRFLKSGELVFDFSCRIDAITPSYTAYVDMSRYLGQDIEIAIVPAIDVAFEQTDEMDIEGLYAEPYRPQIHFTVKSGFNNDPNGLVYYRGKYHLFYQYNPCGEGWNVHWGHAVSDDLLHWEEKDPALFPDETGMMFSGSAIEDKASVSGLGNDPLLLYYTAAGNMTEMSKDKPFTQCLAYSSDGGETFEKYAKNPLLPQRRFQNRDPKVVWVEELQKYVMAVYLTGEDYAMFVSENLLDWDLFTEYAVKGDWECPDLYALTCEEEKYWIVSGARGYYALGKFKDDGFVIVQQAKRLEYGEIAYASHGFSGLNGGAVKINWDKLSIPAARFTQQLGFPYELRLEKVGDERYLAAQPIAEIEKLYMPDAGFPLQNTLLERSCKWQVGRNPLDIRFIAKRNDTAKLLLGFFGVWLTIDGNMLSVNGAEMPVCVSGDTDTIDLRVVVDRCSAEIFADGGKACLTAAVFCDYNLPYVQIEADKEVRVEKFVVKELESVYKR